MTDTHTVRMLARYNAWADKLIFDAVSALPPGEAARERKTLFKSMIGTLNHNYIVDLIWQAHLEGRNHGFIARNMVLHANLDDLWTAQKKVDAWYIAWSDRQTAVSLDERLPFTFISGEKSSMTRGEMLQHVVNHTTYHRGWISGMFYELPVDPPTTDLPVFLREATPDWR